MGLKMLVAILPIAIYIDKASAADKVRIGVSNYNISNLTVGVAQTHGFSKQERIDAEIIRIFSGAFRALCVLCALCG